MNILLIFFFFLYINRNGKVLQCARIRFSITLCHRYSARRPTRVWLHRRNQLPWWLSRRLTTCNFTSPNLPSSSMCPFRWSNSRVDKYSWLPLRVRPVGRQMLVKWRWCLLGSSSHQVNNIRPQCSQPHCCKLPIRQIGADTCWSISRGRFITRTNAPSFPLSCPMSTTRSASSITGPTANEVLLVLRLTSRHYSHCRHPSQLICFTSSNTNTITATCRTNSSSNNTISCNSSAPEVIKGIWRKRTQCNWALSRNASRRAHLHNSNTRGAIRSGGIHLSTGNNNSSSTTMVEIAATIAITDSRPLPLKIRRRRLFPSSRSRIRTTKELHLPNPMLVQETMARTNNNSRHAVVKYVTLCCKMQIDFLLIFIEFVC